MPPEITAGGTDGGASSLPSQEKPKTELSGAHLRYLYAIYEISRTAPEVRSAGVAARMRVSRPSVAGMLCVLTQKGLVAKKRYGKICLTGEGLLVARTFDRKVRFLAERLPLTGLSLTEEEAYAAACAVAALLPDRDWPAGEPAPGDGGR